MILEPGEEEGQQQTSRVVDPVEVYNQQYLSLEEVDVLKRSATRALAALVVAVALVGAACSDDGDHAMGERDSLAPAQLRDDMREVWEDHVTWTRVVIISAAADLPDYQAAVGRLLKNQEDIGDAIKPFYGEAAGTELTRLLKDHIAIAADLLMAAKTANAPAQGHASTRWYANGDDIARFLAKANPEHWPEGEMAKMMRDHLDLTLEGGDCPPGRRLGRGRHRLRPGGG